MNIQEAKQEVKRTVEIYLDKDSQGQYSIPYMKQRPVFLLGAPGIGKTAIMEQIAVELDIALVSYSMTHHTRQSALGLPFIEHREYNGKTYAVSDYTMSEIISTVYSVMEASGKREGILFLDEINCVSETLAPAMLQFLQYKEFGNKRVPEGWVIVTAGNPPEYNKSVRDFDIATLDRIKCLNVQEDFECWRGYALQMGISGAIIGFLELNREWFYRIETSVEGVTFVTARGWEDLSLAIGLYEKKGFPITTDFIEQYVTVPSIARKFSVYYDLYLKYRKDYHIQEILEGTIREDIVQRARNAPFDERIALIELLLESITSELSEVNIEDDTLESLVKQLRIFKKDVQSGPPASDQLLALAEDVRKANAALAAANSLSADRKRVDFGVISHLENFARTVPADKSPDDQFKSVKTRFRAMVKKHRTAGENTKQRLESAFVFLEQAFEDSQEMILFMTQMTANPYCIRFIEQWGCDAYFRHNSGLLIYDVQRNLKNEIAQLADEDEDIDI